MQVNLNQNYDGTVTIDGEVVMIHNAIAQAVDLRDEDYRPAPAAVEAAQKAVDELYLAAE